MRIIFTICALFCFVSLLSAQTEKGKLFISGSSNFSFSSLDRKWKNDGGDGDLGSITIFNFSPILGRFVADGFLVGAQLPISTQTNKDADGDKVKNNSIALAPFARYYFGDSNVKPYLHGSLGYGSGKIKDEEGSTKFNMTIYELGGGLAVFLNEKVSIDMGLGYSSVVKKPKEDISGDPRNITRGMAFSVGFSLFF